ncbi:unnamed protein product [Moneuplotes crassus]|uniref:Uncharacterized protein n=1 Tax=Euplotes crassus TaxID=5936 RepID=A0AAD2D2I2_EUPCR|nr:unnamed protein product [Moneuplotes crassus]
MMKLLKFSSITRNLFHMLPTVRNEIKLTYFFLNGRNLQKVIELGRQCDLIAISDCSLHPKNFTLRHSITFKIRTLDLRGSHAAQCQSQQSSMYGLVDVVLSATLSSNLKESLRFLKLTKSNRTCPRQELRREILQIKVRKYPLPSLRILLMKGVKKWDNLTLQLLKKMI